MAYTTNYFELKTAGITYRFQMQLADAAPSTIQQTSGFQRAWDGQLIEVAGPEIPAPSGIVRVDATPQPGYGSLANLLACWRATDLQAKLYNDAAFWNCRWIGPWDPQNLDPGGEHFMIPMHLEKR